jgi:hypothetical protein
MQSLVITLTPDLAKLYLSTQGRNRPLTSTRVDRLAQDILDGNWQLNGQPLVFTKDWRMIDGQHRCKAVIRAGKSIQILAVVGVEEGTAFDIGGKARAAHDAWRIELGDVAPTQSHAEIARSLLRWNAGKGAGRISDNRLLAFVNVHREALDFVLSEMRCNKKHVAKASIKAAIAAAYYYVDRDRLRAFCHIVLTGVVDKPLVDNAAMRLREWLLQYSSTRRDEVYLQTEAAIAAFCAEKSRYQIRVGATVRYLLPALIESFAA